MPRHRRSPRHFNEAMNPATIDAITIQSEWTRRNSGGRSCHIGRYWQGRCIYAIAANLAPGTAYTATVTTGAQDLSANGLAGNFIWSFTTATQACQAPVPLGSAANFDAVAGSTVTNTGPTTLAGGDLGFESRKRGHRVPAGNPDRSRGHAHYRSDRGARPARFGHRL